MQENHEEGLIRIYIQKIQALAVRAQDGENVKGEIKTVIADACKHFDSVVSSEASQNRSAFKGRLSIYSDMVHASQPQFRDAMRYAASLID